MLQLPWRGAFIFLALLVAVSAPSCANSSENPTDAGSDAKPIGPCGPGTAVKCGDTCVDTQSDFQNCGACGAKCPSDQVCSHGACSAVCGGGTARCGNDCIDTKSDVNDCGGCNQKCPSGNVCSNGSCALTCQTGLTDCNGDCVDVNQNDDNCGACGKPCGGGQLCSNGKCVATCQAGWSSCAVGDAGATTCVDTRFDTNNCGACNAPCPSGELCSPVNNVGTCSLQCNGGTSKCGAACVDENIDPNNCGACNATCSGNCSAGHCCASGQIYCGACDTVANCIVKTEGHIAAGGYHTCAITPTGTLKCWGDDTYGQLGDNNAGTQSSSPISVTLAATPTFVGLGWEHTCVTAGGKAYCWGAGTLGQLGDNLASDEAVPSSALTFGADASSATKIDGGYHHTCALLSDQTVWCWGENFYGEVGDNSAQTERNVPVSTGITNGIDVNAGLDYHACAVLADNTAKCWGDNGNGQCGDGTANAQDDVPTAVSGLTGALAVQLANIHSCAVVSGGGLKCWGYDGDGELGDGKTTDSNVPVAANVTGVLAVATGGSHTCVLLNSGAVECWGYNFDGELGDGTNNDSLTPVTAISSGAIAIAAGESHTCAFMANGSVYCWGYNGEGQLGDGTTNDSNVPVQVQGF